MKKTTKKLGTPIKKFSSKLALILGFFAALSMSAQAQTCTSTGTGTWASSFSCSGTTSPVVYKIAAGDTVTVTASPSAVIDSLIIEGMLIVNNGRKVDLTADGIVLVESGGEVGGGNPGTKFQFVGGTDVRGPFSVTGEAYAPGNTGGVFVSGYPVPVSWMGVFVAETSTGFRVDWQTATEVNNNYFDVEVLIGNVWQNVGTVNSKAPAGNATFILKYSLDVSFNVLKEQNRYLIRIKQTDFDGSFDYSKVVAYYKESNPNVVVDLLGESKIHIKHRYDSPTSIQVLTIDGQVISNFKEVGTSTVVQLPRAGVYFVMVENNGSTEIEKLVLR